MFDLEPARLEKADDAFRPGRSPAAHHRAQIGHSDLARYSCRRIPLKSVGDSDLKPSSDEGRVDYSMKKKSAD
jgi:hypothetical protein